MGSSANRTTQHSEGNCCRQSSPGTCRRPRPRSAVVRYRPARCRSTWLCTPGCRRAEVVAMAAALAASALVRVVSALIVPARRAAVGSAAATAQGACSRTLVAACRRGRTDAPDCQCGLKRFSSARTRRRHRNASGRRSISISSSRLIIHDHTGLCGLLTCGPGEIRDPFVMAVRGHQWINTV